MGQFCALNFLTTVSLCISLLLAPSLSHSQILPDIPVLGGIGAQPLPSPGQCLASITAIPNCLTEILGTVLSLQIRLIGPTCCKIIADLDDKCLPKIIPFIPSVGSMLKAQCIPQLRNGGGSYPPHH